MKNSRPSYVLFVAVMTFTLLPMLSTIPPATADQTWYQSVGRDSSDAPCEESSTEDLAAGWTSWAPSWAQWPNDSQGGFVCNRQITWAFDPVSPSSSDSSAPTCTTASLGSTVIPCAVSTSDALVYGPGGGIVFYDAGSQQSWGRYLEAATTDSSSGIAWCSNTNTAIAGVETFYPTEALAIGGGESNTDAMMAVCSSGAANSARDYTGGGKTDWFLPSLSELNALRSQRHVVGGFNDGVYWSSSQVDGGSAWGQGISSGDQLPRNKDLTQPVRPIRAF